MYGCRVVQKAIELAGIEMQALIVKELSGHVIHCAKDQVHIRQLLVHHFLFFSYRKLVDQTQ